MKFAGLRETKQALSDYVNRSQRDAIVITKRGRPAAILLGVEGLERAALASASGADLWKLLSKGAKGKRAAASSGSSRKTSSRR